MRALALAVSLAWVGTLMASRGVPAAELRLVAPPQFSPVVERYGLQEISFRLEGPVANPYDPDDTSVMADLRTPSGARLRLPAFYYRRFHPFRNTPDDEAGWRLRFTPSEEGEYSAAITLSRRGGPRETLANVRFRCVASGRTGFVTARGRRLVLTTGEPFLALGANRCWGEVRRSELYLEEMALLARHGASVVRVWLAPWWLPVERERGVYDQAACARLDAIMAEAERLGLKVIICIEQHGNLEPAGGEVGLWPGHPYNAVNGGPCRTVRDFFSRAEARRLFRNRLRYLAARYGYSTALLAWELFNEVEYVPLENGGLAWNSWLVEDWHAQMARYLREADAHGHLVATSSDPALQSRLVEAGVVDVMQLHVYADADLTDRVIEEVSRACRTASVPVIVGEFGIKGGTTSPEELTRCLFGATLSGAAGALPWVQDAPDLGPYLELWTAARRFFDRSFESGGAFEESDLRLRNVPARRDGASPRLVALRGGDETWVLVLAGGQEAQPWRAGAALEVPEAAPGEYAIEYWNPHAGRIVRRRRLRVERPPLRVSFDELAGDLALKISWLRADGR